MKTSGQMYELLNSVFVLSIFAYSLTVTGLLIFIFGFHIQTRNRIRGFVLSEFIVRFLYGLAAWTLGIAEGADSFLLMYRDVQKDARFNSRASDLRKEKESRISQIR